MTHWGVATSPNLLFIMSDDHAAHAISAYGSLINSTPNLDRIAEIGMRFDSCFCTNSICTPSRAAVLTGTYNHVNRVTTLDTPMDNDLLTFPKLFQQAGYQTALIGKWHLGHGPRHDPTGFDFWRVLPGQGHYHNPVMLQSRTDGAPGYDVVERGGYVTDLITDDSLQWLDGIDRSRPWLLMTHHKAPHRTWEPSREHFTLYDDVDIPEPATMFDDHATRAAVVQAMEMRLVDLDPIVDLKAPVPAGLSHEEEIRWRYQRYIKDYLRTIASIDDNVGRMLDYLDETGQADNTIVVYTSDQGFFLGDHGWFDKRLMYEESLRMPFVMRDPNRIQAGSVQDAMVLNVDFAPTFCELAGIEIPVEMQGTSFAPLLEGQTPPDWQASMYYRYWMHRDRAHNVPAHYGVRTSSHKLICYYNDPLDQQGANGPIDPVEWELYDLEADPMEITNVYGHAGYATVQSELEAELARLQHQLGDTPAR
ncbi:MAG: sulfatase [Acidimicrobiales bacterium]|nr:sulfatase [Acidimicrobiales bacterium]